MWVSRGPHSSLELLDQINTEAQSCPRAFALTAAVPRTLFLNPHRATTLQKSPLPCLQWHPCPSWLSRHFPVWFCRALQGPVHSCVVSVHCPPPSSRFMVCFLLYGLHLQQ